MKNKKSSKIIFSIKPEDIKVRKDGSKTAQIHKAKKGGGSYSRKNNYGIEQ